MDPNTLSLSLTNSISVLDMISSSLEDETVDVEFCKMLISKAKPFWINLAKAINENSEVRDKLAVLVDEAS